MNKPLPRSYWRGERDEQMRRARNGAFYATAPGDISEQGRQRWRDTVAEHVRSAREANRGLIRAPKV